MSEDRARPEALGEFRNDFGAIDGDGMWRYKINGSSGRWIRDRQRVRGLISLGQRKPDKPTDRHHCDMHISRCAGLQ